MFMDFKSQCSESFLPAWTVIIRPIPFLIKLCCQADRVLHIRNLGKAIHLKRLLICRTLSSLFLAALLDQECNRPEDQAGMTPTIAILLHKCSQMSVKMSFVVISIFLAKCPLDNLHLGKQRLLYTCT